MAPGAEQIKPRSTSHCVSADRFPVGRPLPCSSVSEAVGVGLRKGHNTIAKIIKSPVSDAISQRTFKLKTTILIKLPESDNLPFQNVLGLKLVSPSYAISENALLCIVRNG